MSSQAHNDPRDRSRFTGRNGRQQWMPRNPGIMNPPASNFNAYPSGNDVGMNVGPEPFDGASRGILNTPSSSFDVYIGGNGGYMNLRPVQMNRGNGGYRGARGGRSYMGRPQNQRGERTEAREGGRGRGVRDNERMNHRREENVSSDLPQLVQEIQDKLTKGCVECMICYDMVKRSANIWSCSSCYSIFHLNCIKKWARAPSSVDTSAEKSQAFNWRCPGCQSVQLIAPKEIRYKCFCEKRHDPPPDLYLTPHSCGEPCGKPLEREAPEIGLSREDICPHVCVLQCHPGPCPPCKAFAPPRPCPCGKKVITTRCSDRKSVNTCGQFCDKLLDCGRHRCDRVCHLGPCEPCKVQISALCFCKMNSRVLFCGDMSMKGDIKLNTGVFPCNSTCGKKLECGNHHCAETCHPYPCRECELLPSKVNTCYCGNTTLKKDHRKSCLDPIPTCQGTCGKLLPCGMHQCQEKCHSGPCPPCCELVTQKCCCGSTSRNVECYKSTMAPEKFVCNKPCGHKKTCGRHRCSERCCPLSLSIESLPGDWNPHFCSIVCGKKLRCKQHSCESFCHSGHCPPCPETIFTDLTCACGRTSIPPPLPCGTPPPSCQYPCSILQPCGHQSTHTCHFGDCPPCSIPVAKECVGRHVVLRNIPCGSKDIRCNKLCGNTRRCGLHACARACHLPPCDPPSSPFDSSSCGQTCGAPRKDCRHTCTALCHPGDSCPDVRCEFPVKITCSCGRINATVPCDSGGGISGFNADIVLEASILQKLLAPLQLVEGNDKRVPLGQRKLMCDDECAKLEKKRVLADAFDVSLPSLDALHFGEDPAVSELLADLLRRDPKWVLSVEERCKRLVLGKSRESLSSVRVHVFCAMPKEKRDAIRLIAERWKLSVRAAGWEPKRFIVVHATLKSKPPPRIMGSKGSSVLTSNHPSVFDPTMDVDPRLVVALLDLPNDSDIRTLVMRFGGECELVRLNDKNALAVFSDPARAATAMRRLDNGSVYQGAAVVQQTSAVGAPHSGLKGNPWKKAVVKESNGVEEESWGDGEQSSGGSANVSSLSGRGCGGPITLASNRWTILNPDCSSTSGESSAQVEVAKEPPVIGKESECGPSSTNSVQIGSISPDLEDSEEVVDDWEKKSQLKEEE